MPTIQQLVRKGRKALVDKSKAGFGLMSAASWRMCSCVHNNPEET